MLIAAVIAGVVKADIGARPPISEDRPRIESANDSAVWRTANHCAVNALYIVLRLRDIPVSYEEVSKHLKVEFAGAKLADVREAAVGFGLDAWVVRADPESLRRCPLPCIAHVEEEKSVTGHYVVITALDAQRVEYIDGTTVVTKTVGRIEFEKNWTGYLLVVQERDHVDRWLYAAAAGLGGITAALALWRWFRIARPHGPTAPRATRPLMRGT